MQGDSDGGKPERWQQAALDLLAAAMVATGGAAGAVVAGPFAGAAAAGVPRAVETIMRWRLTAAGEAAHRAIEEVGSFERLAQALQEDERLQVLVLHGLEAGARTSLAAKRRVLGLAIAQAVSDRAQVDIAQLRIAALEDLDVPHVQALERLRRAAELAGPVADEAEREARDKGQDVEQKRGAAVEAEVANAAESEHEPVLQGLLRHALVAEGTTYRTADRVAVVTRYGRALLDDLTQEGALADI